MNRLIGIALTFAACVDTTATTPPPEQAPAPAELVMTPHGYFDSSCVARVAPGEVVQDDGSIRAPDGSVRPLARCAFPNHDQPNKVAYADTAVINGYIGTAATTQLGTVKALSAHWTVPAPPLLDNGQTVYMFNGLESLSTISILQPVLAYHDHHWTATSWNCCKEGTQYTGNTIDVNPGDTIVGTMTGSSCDAGTGLCASWTITTADVNTGQSSVLQTSSWGVPTNWVFAAALEVYGVSACGQLPASNAVSFDGQSYTKINGDSGTTAPWDVGINAVQPDCGYYGLSLSSGNTASLDWDSANQCGKLGVDQQLQPGADLWSCDHRFRLIMQSDGNLVLYHNGSPLWGAGTNGQGGYYAVMQGDGNLVVYTNHSTPVWGSGTNGHPGATLAIQNDGNLVIYDGSHAIWASNTVVGPDPAPATPGGAVTTPPIDDGDVEGGCQAGTSGAAWPAIAIALAAITRRRRRR